MPLTCPSGTPVAHPEAQVTEDLFHEQFLKQNNRCFTKLTSDMLK